MEKRGNMRGTQPDAPSPDAPRSPDSSSYVDRVKSETLQDLRSKASKYREKARMLTSDNSRGDNTRNKKTRQKAARYWNRQADNYERATGKRGGKRGRSGGRT